MQKLKKLIKDFNVFFDGLTQEKALWVLVGLTVLGLIFVTSETALISLLGYVYFGALIVSRWMHINGKL